ncbi:MAG: hypothetical protein PHU23_17520, partial [Dehalococcoidales bacterium]|nr:hypothetical protein [Dehalococcoidales bacterium]
YQKKMSIHSDISENSVFYIRGFTIVEAASITILDCAALHTLSVCDRETTPSAIPDNYPVAPERVYYRLTKIDM